MKNHNKKMQIDLWRVSLETFDPLARGNKVIFFNHDERTPHQPGKSFLTRNDLRVGSDCTKTFIQFDQNIKIAKLTADLFIDQMKRQK